MYVPRRDEVAIILPSIRINADGNKYGKDSKMSYLRHWKLSRSPFTLGAAGRGTFTGGTIEEALARSHFLVTQEKRLGLVLGPSGVGKTTFLKYFCRARKSQFTRENVAMIDLRCADGESVPNRILNSFFPFQEGLLSKQECWSKINDLLFAESAVGHRTVFLLDNLHGTYEEVFQAISQLWSSQIGWSMLLCLDHDAVVDLPRWFIDQCELRIDLPSWDLGQTADYFDFAFQHAGGPDDIFNGQAITRIQELSDGIPRKIVQIAELALVAGAVRKAEKVTSELVDQVCDEFTLSVGGKFPSILAGQSLNAE